MESYFPCCDMLRSCYIRVFCISYATSTNKPAQTHRCWWCLDVSSEQWEVGGGGDTGDLEKSSLAIELNGGVRAPPHYSLSPGRLSLLLCWKKGHFIDSIKAGRIKYAALWSPTTQNQSCKTPHLLQFEMTFIACSSSLFIFIYYLKSSAN